MGADAFRLLLALLSGQAETDTHIRLRTTLVERQSTRALAG